MTGAPASSDAGYGAQAATWTPITSTSGRSDLTAIATPDASPPPPTGTTIRARSGTSSSSSSPSDPCPATIAGSSNGWTNARPPSRARACAASRHSSSDAPPMWTIAPWPRAASALAIGASAGTKTSQRTPRAAAAAASALGVVAGRRGDDAAARPPSPSAASLADAPRTLNEPVRWRFSALSATCRRRARRSCATTAPACGARRFSASGRAAAIVGGGDGLSPGRRGSRRSRPRRRAGARRRRSWCAPAASSPKNEP